MLGYGEESARFFGGDPSSRDLHTLDNKDVNTGEEEGEIATGEKNQVSEGKETVRVKHGQQQDIVVREQHPQDASSKGDGKAEARAKRKARREGLAKSGLKKSVEAPRMLGYGDESARFFGGDPSSRDLDTLDNKDGNTGDADGGIAGDKKQEKVEADQGEKKQEQESAGKGDDTTEDSHSRDIAVKDAKAEARARRKARREGGSIKSVEAPRLLGYEEESARFFECSLDDKEEETKSIGVEEESLPNNPKSFGNKTTISTTCSSLPSDGEPSREGASDNSIELEDLKNPNLIHSISKHDVSDCEISLGLDDLGRSADSLGQHQADAQSLVSDISLGLDDLGRSAGSHYQKQASARSLVSDISSLAEECSNNSLLKSMNDGPNCVRTNRISALSASMVPQRRPSRRGGDNNGLRRSNSEKTKRSANLNSRSLESKKRQTAHRMKRTRVARLNDGKLDASMNASFNMSFSMEVFSLPKVNPRSSYGGKSSADAIKAKNFKNKPNRRVTTDSAAPDPMLFSRPKIKSPNNASLTEGLFATERIIENDGHESIDEIGFSNDCRQKLDFDGNSIELDTKVLNVSEDSGNSAVLRPQVIPLSLEVDDVEEEDPTTTHEEEEPVRANSIWNSFRMSWRRSRSRIKMMENQFFIPPPEEGTTFFDSLFYTWYGYGNDFVIWIYQASFFTIFAMFFVAYFALVFAFAGILVAMESRTGGRCGLYAYDVWSNSHSYYELAFELSWTTFTTVGYGLISPSGDDANCYHIRFACALFAFMGLLFNSLSAAISFSKLERVLTRASVTFSSSMCLQFGRAATFVRGSKGVYGQFWMKNNSMRSVASIETDPSSKSLGSESYGSRPSGALKSMRETAGAKVPFPFIEFRLVNDHANSKNRAVRNAQVNAMVQISAKDAGKLSRGISRRKSDSGTLREDVFVASKDDMSSFENNENEDNSFTCQGPAGLKKERSQRRNAVHESLKSSMVAKALVVQETDSAGHGIEGRVYYPINLEPSDHPYFRRVWYIRHTLDGHSPLLKESVREKIKKDGGWDPQKYRYQDMLASLIDFHRIRFTFKGTSAVSNALIFSQKIFTIEDLYVGYQFGQIFYEKERWGWLRRLWKSQQKKKEEPEDDTSPDDDNLILDKRLIHDILPQQGGGQEPIGG